jgi:hypothetical protein
MWSSLLRSVKTERVAIHDGGIFTQDKSQPTKPSRTSNSRDLLTTRNPRTCGVPSSSFLRPPDMIWLRLLFLLLVSCQTHSAVGQGPTIYVPSPLDPNTSPQALAVKQAFKDAITLARFAAVFFDPCDPVSPDFRLLCSSSKRRRMRDCPPTCQTRTDQDTLTVS